METIEQVLQFINEQTGLVLEEDPYFAGVYTTPTKERYFNIFLGQRISESPVYATLERLSQSTDQIKSVEPNGFARVAIFF